MERFKNGWCYLIKMESTQLSLEQILREIKNEKIDVKVERTSSTSEAYYFPFGKDIGAVVMSNLLNDFGQLKECSISQISVKHPANENAGLYTNYCIKPKGQVNSDPINLFAKTYDLNFHRPKDKYILVIERLNIGQQKHDDAFLVLMNIVYNAYQKAKTPSETLQAY